MRRTRSLSSARLTSWNQRVSERTSSSISVEVEPGDQLAELIAGRVVAAPGPTGELDRAAAQLQRVLGAAGADDRVEHADEQLLVGAEIAQPRERRRRAASARCGAVVALTGLPGTTPAGAHRWPR